MSKQDKKLKIAFVLDTTLDVEDGVQQYILVLGDWLKKQGHEVHYIVGETHRTDIDNLHSITKNIKVHFNGNKVVMPLPASKKRIKKLLDSENFDILHVQVPYSPFFAAKVIKSASKKTTVIGTFHILPFGKVAFFGTWFLGLILRKNLKRFDRQISASSANKSFSHKTFRTDSIVIPNMVKLNEFAPPSNFVRNNKSFEILFLGRLTNRKGPKELLNAIKYLEHTYPGISYNLKIAGKGELDLKLKKFVADNGLEEKVKFLGFVSNQEKVELMRKADIAVFPSLSGECFGIVLIEAMAAKSGAVIGGKNPGYQTVLGEIPESLVDPRDTKEFGDLLYKLIKDESFRSAIHNKQQKIVGQYDFNIVGRRVLDEYMNCINDKNQT